MRWRVPRRLMSLLVSVVFAAPASAQFFVFDPLDVGFDFDLTPTCVAAGDFNEDTLVDLVATGRNQLGVAVVLLNQGAATFAPPSQIDLDDHSEWVSVGHYDADTHLDLAIAMRGGSGVVRILKGHGDGTFALPVDYAVSRGPFHLAAADFSGDGLVDLAVIESLAESVSFLLNTGNNSFVAGPRIHLGQLTRGTAIVFYMTAADFDLNNHPDLAVGLSSGTVAVLLNSGAATFSPPRFYRAATPTGIASGDLDQDGDPDVVYAELDPDHSGFKVLRNQGGGLFGGISSVTVGGWLWYVTLADLNGDDLLDGVITDAFGGQVSFLANHSSGPGNLAMGFAQPFKVGGFPRMVLPVDVDNDCDTDLVVANIGTHTIHVLRNLTPQERGCNAQAASAAVMGSTTVQSAGRSAAPGAQGVADQDGDGVLTPRDTALYLGRWPHAAGR